MDLDGTLCDVSPYLHLGFHAFMEAAVTVAQPNPEMVAVVRQAARDGVAVLVVTGREEQMREATLAWLERHGVTPTASYFRANGDRRFNVETKRDLLADLTLDGWTPILAYDDDPEVCAMFEQHGLDVVRVGRWDVRLT